MTEPVLPDQTSDDTDVGWGDDRDNGEDEADGTRRLLDERPPHYDGK